MTKPSSVCKKISKNASSKHLDTLKVPINMIWHVCCSSDGHRVKEAHAKGPLRPLESVDDIRRYFNGKRVTEHTHLAVQIKIRGQDMFWAGLKLQADVFDLFVKSNSYMYRVPNPPAEATSWALTNHA